MNLDRALTLIEVHLLQRSLLPVERLILQQSWFDRTYPEIAELTTYGGGYLKAIGSRLWAELSSALNQRITKKNWRLAIAEYYRSLAQPGTASELAAGAIALDLPPLPGLPLPLDSPFYIERPPIEALASAELDAPGCALRLRAPSKMGKSSLLLRLLAQASQRGFQTASINFQEAERATLSSLSRCLRWLCANVSRQLALPVALDTYWDDELGSKISCKLYFEDCILRRLTVPLAIAFSELHCLCEYPAVAREVFTMLRFWHEQAQRQALWSQVRYILSYATDNYVPLNLGQSPFNVGLALHLPPFSPSQVTELAQRYQLVWDSDRDTSALMAMVGGHPYLVSLAFYHLRRGDLTLADLLETASTPTGIYSRHLRDLWLALREQPSLAISFYQVMARMDVPALNPIAAHKLESLGLIELQSHSARIAYPLYRYYFEQQLDAATLTTEVAIATDMTDLDPTSLLPRRSTVEWLLRDRWPVWQQQGQPLALVLIGLDGFPLYAADRGRAAGEACLRRLALLLGKQPEATAIAHSEKAQFAVVLEAEPQAALAIAEKLRASCSALNLTYAANQDGGELASAQLTLSLGVVCWQSPARLAPEQVLAAATSALQSAQRQGGNCVALARSPDSAADVPEA